MVRMMSMAWIVSSGSLIDIVLSRVHLLLLFSESAFDGLKTSTEPEVMPL